MRGRLPDGTMAVQAEDDVQVLGTSSRVRTWTSIVVTGLVGVLALVAGCPAFGCRTHGDPGRPHADNTQATPNAPGAGPKSPNPTTRTSGDDSPHYLPSAPGAAVELEDGVTFDRERWVRRRPVRPDRIWVGGISGGGKTASRMALLYPEVFRGGLFVVGASYFPPVPMRDGRVWDVGIRVSATREVLQRLRTRRFVLVTGENDFNHESVSDMHRAYKKDGLPTVLLLDVPGMYHGMPSSDVLEEALSFLDRKRPPGSRTGVWSTVPEPSSPTSRPPSGTIRTRNPGRRNFVVAATLGARHPWTAQFACEVVGLGLDRERPTVAVNGCLERSIPRDALDESYQGSARRNAPADGTRVLRVGRTGRGAPAPQQRSDET